MLVYSIIDARIVGFLEYTSKVPGRVPWHDAKRNSLFSCCGTIAVENVQTNHVQATKFFRDGQLLIEKNGKIYNVQGVEVK